MNSGLKINIHSSEKILLENEIEFSYHYSDGFSWHPVLIYGAKAQIMSITGSRRLKSTEILSTEIESIEIVSTKISNKFPSDLSDG